MVDGPKAIALHRIFELYAEAGASFLSSAKDTNNRTIRKEFKEKKGLGESPKDRNMPRERS